MAELELPEGMKLKIRIDYFESHHKAHKGLLAEDHFKIAKDLEKISKMPLLNDCYNNNLDRPIELGKSKDNFSYHLPFRQIDVICNTDQGSGRLIGYEIKDVVETLYRDGNKKWKTVLDNWYNDATFYTTPDFVGQKVMKLDQFDKL